MLGVLGVNGVKNATEIDLRIKSAFKRREAGDSSRYSGPASDNRDQRA
jgi:hypothetical protein